MVTLKEIARECNVSATTVSNILNGKPKVSEETRLRVLDVVKKRGYQPNYIAQGLRNQKTKTIGIIAEDISQFSTPGMIESIMACCEEKGYRTIVQNLDVYKRQPEVLGISKKIQRLFQNVEFQQQFVYNTGAGEGVVENPCNNDPGKKMRQIGDGLYRFLSCFGLHFVE